MMRSTAIVTLSTLALLAGCGSGGGNETLGGVSKEEAAQLDNAAEMLDASPDSLTAPENMPLDTESNSGGAAGNTI
jgi:hypothetical protein